MKSDFNRDNFVVICCATAVAQSYYWNFARYLVDNGFSVLTFDYRGIGASAGGASLKDSKFRKQDWGELDMPAAIEWLSAKAGGEPVFLVGHSAGGVLIGLLPNWRKLKKVVAVGCSTGFVGEIGKPFRWIAYVLLNIYFPVAISVFGYLPAKRLNLGEDLPAAVARQWADWCNDPGYVRNAFGKTISTHYYGEFDREVEIINAVDDPITTKANTDDFISLLPKARIKTKFLEPSSFNLKEISHMGFFRMRNGVIWPTLLNAIRE